MRLLKIYFATIFIFSFGLAHSQSNEKIRIAQQYLQQRNFSKALPLYKNLYHTDPSQYNYNYYLLCLIELQQPNEAEKIIKKQLRKNPDNGSYLVDLGYVYSLFNNSTKAKKQYQKAINSLLPVKNQIQHVANAFQYRRENDLAIETYLKGRKILKTENVFHYELARIYQITALYSLMTNEYLDKIKEQPEQLASVKSRIQNALNTDKDGTMTQIVAQTILQRLQKHPDYLQYNDLYIWYTIQQKDFKAALQQTLALDRRFPDNGERLYELSLICMNNHQYTEAANGFQYIIKKGDTSPYHIDARIQLLNTLYYQILNNNQQKEQLLTLEKDYINLIQELGINSETIDLIKNLSQLQAFHLSKIDQGRALLEKTLSSQRIPYKTTAEIKLLLGDILLQANEPWEATLCYSQVEKMMKNDPIGHQAKYKNAQLTYYLGEFQWAKAQADVLKGATTKLIANDAMQLSLLIQENIDPDSTYNALSLYAKADYLQYRKEFTKSIILLDSIQHSYSYHPILDDILYKKYQIYYSLQQYTKAAEQLNLLIDNYGYDLLADDAIMTLAALCENKLGDISQAKKLYKKLLNEYPNSILIDDARDAFRRLRGDLP